ncbi:hypothetical protein, partial [Escherichia coli]|uniref:hypothetical protein n=1 Tax=Escherichia coli TaxID=562 RepID=UPI001C5A6B6E
LTALSAEFTIGEGELMAHDVPLGCAPDEYDDLISGTCSHLPYIVDAFMVTRENTTSETQKLLEWFLTPQGQSLVEDVGYVPMYKTLP